MRNIFTKLLSHQNKIWNYFTSHLLPYIHIWVLKHATRFQIICEVGFLNQVSGSTMNHFDIKFTKMLKNETTSSENPKDRIWYDDT